jgi:hypothetical protein
VIHNQIQKQTWKKQNYTEQEEEEKENVPDKSRKLNEKNLKEMDFFLYRAGFKMIR